MYRPTGSFPSLALGPDSLSLALRAGIGSLITHNSLLMTENKSEPHNPFYLLLLIASLFFVVTALAYALIPMLESSSELGEQSSSGLRKSLRDDGWLWLLIELGLMIVLALASMILDRSRLRRLQNDSSQAKMPSPSEKPSPATTESDDVSPGRDRQATQGD